jgi:hypothetical protein
MAKKRKKDKAKKEEEYEFKPPEFDEKEFIRKELRDTRTVLITVGYAALFGSIATVIAHISSSLVGVSFLLVFLGIFSLKNLYPLLGIKTEDFQKKNWAGNVAWFFLTFLAVWVLTFNYPISDKANPKVEDIVVWVTNEDTGNITAIDYEYIPSTGSYGWVARDGGPLPGLVAASSNYTINITARITDNGVLRVHEISVGANEGAYVDMEKDGDIVNRYDHVVNGEDLTGDHIFFFIHAEDDRGNEITFVPVSGIPLA